MTIIEAIDQVHIAGATAPGNIPPVRQSNVLERPLQTPRSPHVALLSNRSSCYAESLPEYRLANRRRPRKSELRPHRSTFRQKLLLLFFESYSGPSVALGKVTFP